MNVILPINLLIYILQQSDEPWDTLRSPRYIATILSLNLFCLLSMFIFYRFIGKSAIIDKRQPFITLYGALCGLIYGNVTLHESYHLFPGLLSIGLSFPAQTIYFFALNLCTHAYVMRVVYLLLADYVNVRLGAKDDQGDLSTASLHGPKKKESDKEEISGFQKFRQRCIVFQIHALLFLLRIPRTKDEKGRLILTTNVYSRKYLLRMIYYIICLTIVQFGIGIAVLSGGCGNYLGASQGDFDCYRAYVRVYLSVVYFLYFVIFCCILSIGSCKSSRFKRFTG